MSSVAVVDPNRNEFERSLRGYGHGVILGMEESLKRRRTRDLSRRNNEQTVYRVIGMIESEPFPGFEPTE